jgi:hypothetical protein
LAPTVKVATEKTTATIPWMPCRCMVVVAWLAALGATVLLLFDSDFVAGPVAQQTPSVQDSPGVDAIATMTETVRDIPEVEASTVPKHNRRTQATWQYRRWEHDIYDSNVRHIHPPAHTRAYTHAQTHIHIVRSCVHACICTCIHTFINRWYTHVYIYMYIYIHIYTHIYICVCVCVCVCVNIDTHICRGVGICIHHTHAHTQHTYCAQTKAFLRQLIQVKLHKAGSSTVSGIARY